MVAADIVVVADVIVVFIVVVVDVVFAVVAVFAAAVVTGFYFQRKFQTTSSKKAKLNLSAANA